MKSFIYFYRRNYFSLILRILIFKELYQKMVLKKYSLMASAYFMLLTINDSISALYIKPSISTQLYVVPFSLLIGNNGDGSLSHPDSSIQQALNHIEQQYYDNMNTPQRTTINLYPTHHFVDTLRFTQVHSHTQMTTMSDEHAAFYEEITAH